MWGGRRPPHKIMQVLETAENMCTGLKVGRGGVSAGMRSLGFERKTGREESGPVLGHSRRRRAGAVGVLGGMI